MFELLVLQISYGASFQQIEEIVKPQIMNTVFKIFLFSL